MKSIKIGAYAQIWSHNSANFCPVFRRLLAILVEHPKKLDFRHVEAYLSQNWTKNRTIPSQTKYSEFVTLILNIEKWEIFN